MFKTVRLLIMLVWLVDVMNVGFAKCLDTTYELNGFFWIFALLFLLLESCNIWEDANGKKN